ncbi:response regulator transcription factor [Chloroflexota bacterium]
MERIRVLLADDHALFREGLAGIIRSQPDMEVVGEANDGLEAFVKAQELKPDLILMDVQMPGMGGLDAAKQVKQVLPETIIVMLTVRDDDEKLFEALKNGAQGYLLKEIRSQDMLAMLRGAMQGEAALSPSLAGHVLAEFRRLSRHLPNYPELEGDEATDLTHRELDVLTVASQGASDKEVADRLSISVHTVKSHIRNILSKLHVNTRREAARVAKSKGLL